MKTRNQYLKEIGEKQTPHDPEVAAQAMRDGVPVAQREEEHRAEIQRNAGIPVTDAMEPGTGRQASGFRLPAADFGGTAHDRVFTDRVDLESEYGAALRRARTAAAGTAGPVDRDVILEATATLKKYQDGKAVLTSRLVENKEYFRLIHNGTERREKGNYAGGRYDRNTGWIFSAVTNKVADYTDNFPEATVLPREKNDEESARQLTAVIPAVLEKNEYKKIYRHTAMDKVEGGTGITMVWWDTDRENGQGDVGIRRIDPLNIFTEPGVEDVQDSANVFAVELRRNDDLIEQYPEIRDLKDHLGTPGLSITRYTYDANIDTGDMSYVVNWYYKRRQDGKMRLHYCRYVNDVVLFASENDPRWAQEGWYRHGLYPYVFDAMYPEPGSPFGFGVIDIAKDIQEDIDEMGAEILRNVKQSARRRYLCRNNGGINETEYMDLKRDIVHVEGGLDENAIREITCTPLPASVMEWYQNKVNEMKEITANRDVTQGGTGGTSTASGIAALQESGNKVSRDLIACSYESFKKICELVIELIRQFYSVPRAIRITGENGSYEFMEMSNEALQSREMPGDFGVESYRTAEPAFDLTVKAYKANPWSKAQANQDAINMYSMGFFNPERGMEALACLELLQMDNKEKAKQIINDNYKKYQEAAAQAAAAQAEAAAGQTAGQTADGRQVPEEESAGRPAARGNGTGNTVFEKAKAQAQAGTQPR